ncbi:hypothetical protein SEPCBS119000_003831 [Sporothrix epigloea]|uniref:F-box domain-containing protein n=1 Tax=Sporothrix epigloea TaxID=1892477 RepID=A0ABP0DSZ2_9PEZI
MDTLPVELLHQILRDCDTASVCGLRLLTRTLADVGYDYLLSSDFCALPWRDDIARLRAVASHKRLRSQITSITFYIADPDVEKVCEAVDAELGRHPNDSALVRTRRQLVEFGQRRRAFPPLEAQDPDLLAAALRSLDSLRSVAVLFRQLPHNINVLLSKGTRTFGRAGSDDAAIKRVNVLMTALQLASEPRRGPPSSSSSNQSSRNITPTFSCCSPSCVSSPASSSASSCASSSSESASAFESCQNRCRLTSLSFDQLPLELLRNQLHRRLWFQCKDVFGGLTRLDMTLEASKATLPSAKFRVINGLSYILRMAPNLTHLSLDFRINSKNINYFAFSLPELLGETGSLDEPPPPDYIQGSSRGRGSGTSGTGFRFRALTDLRLNGIGCDAVDLRGFLLRHASTLERLHLGGPVRTRTRRQGAAGGLQLGNSTFLSFLRSLRGGRLPRLQQINLEGRFFCITHAVPEEDVFPDALPAAMPNIAQRVYESYDFRRTDDEKGDWIADDAVRPPWPTYRSPVKFEAYVLGHIEEYPGIILPFPPH